MRVVRAIVLAICSSWLFSQSAFAEKRVALVIGNSSYQNVSHLMNPANDAAAMTATFKKANFDVVDSRVDLSGAAMRRVLRDFSDKARDADIAVIYYAGHGIEVDGINYLIPVDAVLERDADVYDEAFPLDRILVAVEPVRQLRLIILDACRDNPFSKTMKRTIGSRSIGRGLAKVEPSNPNTMIAFAAKAGFTAFDGDKKTSPFAAALAEHLTKPGLDLRKAFGFVRDDVLKATNNKQEPFIYGSLGGNDVALVPAPSLAAPPAAAVPDPNAVVRRDYELAAQVGTKEAWDYFLSTYPDGFYAKLAQAQRNKLAAEEARLAATEKARFAAEEQARLATEGAKAAEQTRAAAEAKAAEQARIAAEKKKSLEEARLAEVERAKAAAQAKAEEDARIAAAKAKAAEEAKAAQQAKAAEEARLDAEKKKAQEEAKAAEAERVKAAAQAKATEEARLAAEKKKAQEEAKTAEAERAKAAVQAKAAEDARIAADRALVADEKKTQDDRPIGPLAALTPADQPGETIPKPTKPAAEEIPRLLQTELRRVGCNTGAIDGNWNAATQKSLGLFNKNAGTTLDVKVASLDALDILRSKTARVCPLICDHGYKADGENCVKITCKAGYQVGDDNTCERTEPKKPAAKHESRPEQRSPLANQPPAPAREPPLPSSGGRCGATSCSQALNGCTRRCTAKGVNCGHCSNEYSSCMRTGTFIGHVCQHSGLARN